jgi:hypothetical protein
MSAKALKQGSKIVSGFAQLPWKISYGVPE